MSDDLIPFSRGRTYGLLADEFVYQSIADALPAVESNKITQVTLSISGAFDRMKLRKLALNLLLLSDKLPDGGDDAA